MTGVNPATSVRLAVVIPYYQREAGLLRRALDSVKAQTLDEPIEVVVVDDGSPLAAREELEGWEPGPRLSLRLLVQANAGPGVARNHALDSLGDKIQLVAFLDSDDRWSEGHLSRAVAALDAGADLYFANCFFEESGKLLMDKLLREPTSVPANPVTGETLERLVLDGLVHTPTVAYRYCVFPNVRFPAGFYRFGEDQTFWLSLCAQGARSMLARDVGTIAGKGVSIYSGGIWGSVAYLATTADEIRYRKHGLRHVPLSASGAALMRLRLAAARRSMAGQLLHHGRRGRLALCWSQVRADPMTLLSLPGAVREAIISRRPWS